jgi:hypothetical protein
MNASLPSGVLQGNSRNLPLYDKLISKGREAIGYWSELWV